MLKSRIKQPAFSSLNYGNPGYLSTPGRYTSGGGVNTLAAIDNRELQNADAIIELSGFGVLIGIDPQAGLPDDLVMVFGNEGDHVQEVVLFDKVFTTDVEFKLNYQFHLVANGYEGAFTLALSTGEVLTKYVYVTDVGDNNFTTIRFKNTKLSNSNVYVNLQAFNVVLHK